ncbi:hypothetical protein ACFQ0B_44390 [Nonomuraea thailandensis]
MPRQGGSFTNHAGVIDFNGGSYFFYHNGALPGGAVTPGQWPWRGSPTTPTARSPPST